MVRENLSDILTECTLQKSLNGVKKVGQHIDVSYLKCLYIIVLGQSKETPNLRDATVNIHGFQIFKPSINRMKCDKEKLN